MAKGVKTGGRKKGSPNKITASTKAALEQAFNKLGGVPSLVAWAQSDPCEFYKIWSKLVPADVKLGGDGPSGAIVIRVVHE